MSDSTYRETLEWLRIQLLKRDPRKLGDLVARIDSVLAPSQPSRRTHQAVESAHDASNHYAGRTGTNPG